MEYTRSQTWKPLTFLMISSVDHISGATGLAPTVTISKNGGSFVAPQGTIEEIGNGWYKVVPDADDFDTLGVLLLHATAATADPYDEKNEVVTGLVDLGPSQVTDIVGNVHGSVGSVLTPVTCKSLRAGCK